jgi:hypothetical protein
MNNNINPHLYNAYLHLKDTLNAKMVHRRKRKTANSIEIVFLCDAINALSGHINTLKEAEACGFWIVCRRQTGKKHAFYHGLPVFQLFLTPVHPKKALENKIQAAQQAEEVTFEPIPKHQHQRTKATRLPANTMYRTVCPSSLLLCPSGPFRLLRTIRPVCLSFRLAFSTICISFAA